MGNFMTFIFNWSDNIYVIKRLLNQLFDIIKYYIFISYDKVNGFLPKIDHNLIVFLSLSFLLTVLLWYLLLRKVRNKDIRIPSLRSISAIVPGDDKPRFRKRDKIRYYATRLNRKFQDLTKKLQNIKSKDQKQKLMSIFAKKILHLKEQGPKLLKRSLPDTFLEPEIEEYDSHLPEEFQLILDSIKVFGHLEKGFLLEICKKVETVKLENGQFLFKKGDADENVFVVKSGKIKVFIEEGEISVTIHEVQKGENIHSLLSVLDVITGNIQPYKTVQAIAMMPSEVLRLNVHSFLNMFQQSSHSMVRIVQLIAMRLQRVTFLCLHNYLGLSSELMSKENLSLSSSKVVKINQDHPTVMYKSKVPKHSSGVDVNRSPQKKRMSFRKSRDHSSIIRSDEFMEISNDGLQGSRARSPSVGYRDVTRRMDSVFFFGNDNEDNEKTDGTELELGETPGSVRFHLARKESSHFDEALKRRPQSLRSSSLISKFIENEEDSISTFKQDPELLSAAKEDIAKLLGLSDLSSLSELRISLVPAGTSLIKEGEEDTDVYFVVLGELHVLQHNVVDDPNKLTTLFIAHPGELCGISTVISTEPNYYSVKALNSARVVVISRSLLYTLIKDDPNVLLRLGNILARRMSPFLRQIDFALEWISVKAGYSLYQTGDVAKSVYIILNGRFRQISIKPDGTREIVNELGRGELCGFVEVLSDQPRATTLIAIRDSELAQIPSGLLTWIKRKVPHVVTRLIQLLADKLFVSMSGKSSSIVKGPVATMANLRTIAVIGSSQDVPLESFVLELQHSMMHIGPSIRLTSNIIVRRLGSKALDPLNEHRLSSWLSQQEDHHRIVFYVCDNYHNSIWTRRCIRQADSVLVVALANKDPRLGVMEQSIESDQTKVTKILVLLYPIDTDYPPIGKTSEWLNSRAWVTQHYHIRCPRRMFIRRKREHLLSTYKRIFEKEIPNPHSDMSRLARYITGTTIGLVLGGGGARGCSHVGSIRAMYEAGIPVDMIGGTSIGSFIGALWAEETRITQFTQRARSFSKDMNSFWKMLLDLTYSPVSLFSGKAMNAILEKIFKDRQIEDLWIPYFCITTDITNSRMRAHTNGSLWRFVRASMSMSGYLPPLCHPDDGSLLLDGGYVNNLPADVMRDMGAEMIFAIDVGSLDTTDLTNYGDWLSGWKLLYHKFISRKPMKVLNLSEIQSRLAYVSCVRQMEQVKASGICEYMRPPIEHYKTLQFGSFDEIQEVGYNYTKDKISQWQIDDSLKPFASDQLKWLNLKKGFEGFGFSPRAMKSFRTNTVDIMDYVIGSSNLDIKQQHFIDLAELVSRIGHEDDDIYETDTDDSEEEHLAKVRVNDRDQSTAEILIRTKDSNLINFNYLRHNIDDSLFEQDKMSNVNNPNNNSVEKKFDKRTTANENEGYDEDVEDGLMPGVTASDPENFHRVLNSSRRRKHRRSSLNRLHKSVTFDKSLDSN